MTWLLAGPGAAAVIVPAVAAVLTGGWATGDRLAPALSQTDIVVQGTVCAVPRRSDRAYRFLLETARDASPHGVPARVYLSWYRTGTFPAAGERWQVKVRLKRPRGLSNPGAFDFEKWAFVRRIGATGYVRDSPLNRRLAAGDAICRLAGMRHRVASQLRERLAASPAGGHLLAASVGVRDGLSPGDWALLRRTGTAHLMAISGLHVGLVAAFLLVVGARVGHLLLRVGVPLNPLAVGRGFAVSGAAAYAALAGFSLPTVRALVMVTVFAALAGVRRSISGWQVLAAALFAVLLIEPAAPLNAGFWLSFCAVGVLLLGSLEIGSPSHRATMHRAVRVVRAQIALTVGLAPLTIWYFALVSLIAPVCNLLVVPAFALSVVPLVLLATMSLFVSTTLAEVFLGPAAWCMENILRFLGWIDRFPGSVWHPPPVTSITVGLIVAMTLVLVWPRPLPGRWMAGVLVVSLLGLAPRFVSPALRIVIMDVGQGLAVLVQTPDHALVFDAGPPTGSGDAGRSVVVSTLRRFGIRRLDTLLVSHGDADHAGGATALLSRYPDAQLVATERYPVGAHAFRRCEAGLEWRWERVRFRILHPGRDSGWSENDASCVLLVQTEDSAILLPGDIEFRAEKRLVRSGDVPVVDLVIAPHHGSRTSSSHGFVAATRPRFVVFSAGHLNRWRFPDSDIVNRWIDAGACLLTTAETGALIFETRDDGRLELVRRQRIDGRRPWTEAGRGLRGPCRLL